MGGRREQEGNIHQDFINDKILYIKQFVMHAEVRTLFTITVSERRISE